jgi:pimeloyl-ACP methyl ester carboxylesterase
VRHAVFFFRENRVGERRRTVSRPRMLRVRPGHAAPPGNWLVRDDRVQLGRSPQSNIIIDVNNENLGVPSCVTGERMKPLVLVHGSGFSSTCWDLVVPHLAGPVLAVDLPGRGAHPAELATVTLADCAASVASDVDAAGFDEIVLVGHSLGGCSMPGIVGRLGARVRHAVFVACAVPAHGRSCIDTLPPQLQALAAEHGEDRQLDVLDEATAKHQFGNDLDDEQLAWCIERMVPEAPLLARQPVDLSALRSPLPRTWVRTSADMVLTREQQAEFAANVGNCPIVDLDAGHMVMISQPKTLAGVLNAIAAGP